MKKSPLAESPGGILRVRPNAGCTGNGKRSARRQPLVPIPPINRNPFIVRKFGKVLVRKGCFFFRESGMIVLANGTMQWSSIRDFTNSLSLFCTICLFSFSAIDSRPTSSASPCSAPSPQGEGFACREEWEGTAAAIGLWQQAL
ncbi:MAG: hypothetical protein SPE95_04395 [Oscillospiraceae bacterium]|nr:hypothetical protein [Bacteroidales bacterium]MDY5095490.1 hypothetical protein [Oscillospiraceae bacterium]